MLICAENCPRKCQKAVINGGGNYLGALDVTRGIDLLIYIFEIHTYSNIFPLCSYFEMVHYSLHWSSPTKHVPLISLECFRW